MRESSKQQGSSSALPAGLKIKMPLESYPFDEQTYEDIFYDCLQDFRQLEEMPSANNIKQALQNQYSQKLTVLEELAIQKEREELAAQAAAEANQEDEIKEDFDDPDRMILEAGDNTIDGENASLSKRRFDQGAIGNDARNQPEPASKSRVK